VVKAAGPGFQLKGSLEAAPSGQPLYRVIKEALKQRILAGDYAPDQQLPSENQLMRIFDVSRVTVRQALQQLQKERLVISHQGKGYFVARAKAVQDLARLQGLGEAVAGSGFSAHSEVLGMAEVVADPRVSDALALEPGTPVTCLQRVRHINHQPLGIADLKIEANLADESLAHLLQTEVGTPVLRIERLTLDEAGRPIDFEYLHGRGDAYQFRVRVPRW